MSYMSGRFTVTVKEEGFSGGSDGKESACNAGYPGSMPSQGRYLHISGSLDPFIHPK